MTHNTATYDVVVVGGGSGGVAAAAGAAKAGARTLLVERYGFLGGSATNAGVLAYCGLFIQGATRPIRVVEGIANDTLANLVELGIDVTPRQSPSTGNWVLPLNPEALKIGLDRTVTGAGVTVALHTSVIGADCAKDRIETVRLVDHTGVRAIAARAFVDASGECNLAHVCGVEPSPRYGTGHAKAPASYPMRIAGISGDLVLDRSAVAAAARAVQSVEGRASLRQDGGFMTRLPGTDDLWWLVVDVVSNGLDGVDMTAAEQDGRALAWRAVAALRAQVPGFERANICCTGPQLGIRETRHVTTLDDVVEADAAAGRLRADGIARAGWPMEIHHAPGHTEYRPIGGDGYFHVPLGALRARAFRNLWMAGRTIGADPAAFASVRVMGSAFATGHAAGVGAALQVEANGLGNDASRVLQELRAQKAQI